MLKTNKSSKTPKKKPIMLKQVLRVSVKISLALVMTLANAAFSFEDADFQTRGGQEHEETPAQQLAEHQTPQWVERYILEHHPVLLENSETDHVLAFYYFGSYQEFTIFGMERVKGSDYLSHNTVLIFNDSQLQGYYEELTVFPAGVSAQGDVFFPPNYPAVQNIDLQMGDYPEIQFQQEIDRFESGDLQEPPHSFSYIKIESQY